MIDVGLVAGSVGFTVTWNPQAGQPGNVPSLTGFVCTMNVRLASATSAPYSEFPMNVSTDGTTASYVTQQASDFPVGGIYDVKFVASKSDGTNLLATPVRMKVAQGL